MTVLSVYSGQCSGSSTQGYIETGNQYSRLAGYLYFYGYMNRSKRSFFALHMGHTSGGPSLAQR
jgi:hypothetical protein